MADVTVSRVDFGYFVRPAEETGTGGPRVEPCLGYVVDHPEGMLLFDTGMGSRPDVDAHYRPRRTGLPQALNPRGTHPHPRLWPDAAAGAGPDVADLPRFLYPHIRNYRSKAFDKLGPAGFARTDAVYRHGRDAACRWLNTQGRPRPASRACSCSWPGSCMTAPAAVTPWPGCVVPRPGSGCTGSGWTFLHPSVSWMS